MLHGLISFSALSTLLLGSFSSSPTYQLQNYGLGSGGTNSASSNNYRLNASSGEVNGAPTAGGSDANNSGYTQTRQTNVPLAPTLSNGTNTYYNKLQFTIQTTGSDASDYTYSVAVSINNFTTTTYLQADGTLGASPVYRSYADWGGASGSFAIGLSAATTYKFKVNARQGGFSESSYGPVATSTTANPSLVFSITPNTVSFGNLLPAAVTSGSSPVSFTFATNGAAGGAVYVAAANAGLRSAAAQNTIGAISNDLSTLSEGFGMQGSSVAQTSGGPLALAAPFNGTSNTLGAPTATYRQLFTSNAPVFGGTASFLLKAKASATTPSAADYTEVLTFIASASF